MLGVLVEQRRCGVGGVGSAARRVGDLAAQQLLVAAAPRAGAQLVDERRRVGELERADVGAVDRGHRRDVAGAEALERAHVEVGVVAGRRRCSAAKSSSAPRSEHEMFVQT